MFQQEPGVLSDKLADATHMGAVVLDVRNLSNMAAFYQSVVGLDILAEGRGLVVLGRAARREAAFGELPVVVLQEDRTLPLRADGSAGLFHTAVLFENARELAAAIMRIARRTPELFTGSGDHHVSQAFDLDDPEGNGVELYVDRPRDRWIWSQDKQVHMTTEYIDPKQFIAEHMPGVSEQTREGGNNVTLGHVHLQVGDVASAYRFYVETLGFEQTVRAGRSALFVSAGGYHHHMAMNTWGSRGAGMRAPSLGLGRVDVLVPNRAEVESAADRLRQAGFAANDDGRTVETSDPWGNLIRLTPEESTSAAPQTVGN